MKPLLVLIIATLVSALVLKLISGHYHYLTAGKIGLGCLLIFTAVGHFAFTKGMAMMLPDFVPSRAFVIYFTGVLEILLAIVLFIPQLEKFAGWFLIVFFILILPSNIYAAIKHINYQKADYTGAGLSYLWFRIPFQVLLIFWTYNVTIHNFLVK